MLTDGRGNGGRKRGPEASEETTVTVDERIRKMLGVGRCRCAGCLEKVRRVVAATRPSPHFLVVSPRSAGQCVCGWPIGDPCHAVRER